ncbi:hypothetical protein SAMN04515647_4614 [Cohaesibacter sp. ES.047]|nr:hypothetical protein SAMN04515647_4614 [Cohaesibacter sp. ES.047]
MLRIFVEGRKYMDIQNREIFSDCFWNVAILSCLTKSKYF